jgi:hypothetical protein
MGALRISLIAAVLALSVSWCAAEITVTGRVVDANEAPVAQARIAVRPAGGAPATAARAVSGPTGAFSLSLPAPGVYLIDVQREDYFELHDYGANLEAGHELTLVLNPLREVFQAVNVNEKPSPVSLDETAQEQRLSGTEINDVPYPASHSLRNAVGLMPGVIQDMEGGLHFEGSSENQVYYTLNDFDIGNPITGRFNTSLAVEGIRTVDYQAGRYSAEYGKGSAGVLSIRTDTGTDKFHYTATNFIPGLETHGGVHLGGWTPRVGVNGPLKRGRAWFADNFGGEYDRTFVEDLPQGVNTRTGWSVSNMLHTQTNLTSSQILYADFLLNLSNQSYNGLGPLDPASTTTSLRSHDYFAGFKDQMYFGGGVLVELGYAYGSFFDGQIPQGAGLYVISPEGRSGNYFVNSSQWARRDQGLVNVFLPQFQLAGAHQVKTGIDVERLDYRADFRRTGFEQVGLAGNVLARTVFVGSGAFNRPGLEVAWYAVDSWRLRRNVQVEAGIRQDWDELVRRPALSPRLSVSYSPPAPGNTRLSAGYAITHDAVDLTLFGRALDQHSLTTRFNSDGSVAGGPLETAFTADPRRLKLPRYENWSFSVGHRFSHQIDATLDYLRRRGGTGFTYVNTTIGGLPAPPLQEGPVESGIYALTNSRRDRYDSIQITVRQRLSGQFEWMASYTRSRAVSSAVLDLSMDQPFQVLDNLGPLPWDAPNRFLAWAYLPVPRTKNWAIALLCEAHDGFPFSVVDETGRVVGGVDAHRYPVKFDLNVHIERRFTFYGYRLALRAGFNNITDHANPSAVNNTLGAPNYLQFLDHEGRHLVVRIRVFGRDM